MQSYDPFHSNRRWNTDRFGVSAPLGGSGDEKELIRPGKDSIETHVRSRFESKSSFLLMLIKQIGQGTPCIEEFVQNMGVASQAINGLARSEYSMALARMLVPSSMPLGLGQTFPGDGHKKPKDKREAEVD